MSRPPLRLALSALLLLTLSAQAEAQTGDWVKVWSNPTEGQRAQFNREGQLVVYGSERIQSFDPASGRLLASTKAQSRDVVDFADSSGPLRLAREGKTLSLFRGSKRLGSYAHSSRLDDLAVGPAGKQLAVETADKEVLLLSLPRLRVLHVLKGHAGTINDIAWSRDGKLVASADQGGEIRVWDAGGGLVQRCLAPGVTFSRVGFTPGGELISADFNRQLRFWDPKAGTCEVVPAVQKVQAMTVSEDGTTVATGHWGGKVRLWDVASRSLRATLPLGGVPSHLAFSDDGEWLAVVPGPLGGALSVWHRGPAPAPAAPEPKGGGWTGLLSAGHAHVCFGPEGLSLYGAGNRLMVHTGSAGRGLSGSLAGGEFCGLSPKGVVFVSQGAMSKALSVKLLPSGGSELELLFEVPGPHQGLRTIALQPDGELLAIDRELPGEVRALELYSLETKALVRTLAAPKDRHAGALAFSPDGARIALSVSDTVELYEVESGARSERFEVDPRAEWLGFSAGGERLIVFSRRGASAYAKGRAAWTLELPGCNPRCRPAFAPGEERAAVVCGDKGVRVLDLSRGKVLAAFPAVCDRRLDRVGLAFSPDGKRLAISNTARKTTQIVSIADPPPLDPKEFFLGTIAEARAKARDEGKRVVALFRAPLSLSKNEAFEKALAAAEIRALSDSYVWVRRKLGDALEPSEEAKALGLPSEDTLLVVIDPRRKKPLGWIKDPRLIKKALLKARPKRKRKRRKSK